jgi:hypothetical protein
MFSTNNYFSQINRIDFQSLPEPLQKGHELVLKATSNGSNWSNYEASETIKKTVDIYLSKLNDFLKAKPSSSNPKDATDKKPTKAKKVKEKPGMDEHQPMMVERIPEELRFIRRFVNLNGKTKSKDEILRFINSLQKAIVEKRIRKTSSYAEQIKFVQGRLIEVYNTMKAKIKIELKPETFESLKELTGGEKVLPSINFIKRYIGMNGKAGMKDKARKLLDQINRAYDKGKITDSDPYIVEIHELKKNLKAFTGNKSVTALEIEQASLNGLEGILGCACEHTNSFKSLPSLMNSMDFANLQFNTIGLKGKWLELIGDPSSNFTAMVYGKPKMGKSYLCIDFAGYLARNHGKVLYVAREEGLDMTLQKKLNDKEVAHPNLFVSSVLPKNLTAYGFIFLDSVNKLGLAPEDLNRLKVANPTKSFIFIFQTTKEGKFRGANTFQHDVDVVIEVPERGKAVQMGRFNQGGDMQIFAA